MAEEEGLWVITRAGPYVNAELTRGGFPGWLVNQRGRARTDDPEYLAASDEWLTRVNAIIARHQINGDGKGHRGNVILHQIENELALTTPAQRRYMMSVLPLAKIGLLLGRPHYVEEAKRQFLVHIKYLFDKKTGLWFHGWDFNGRHNFAEALWARGNCWVTIAIPEIIEILDLPEGDAFRAFLIDTLAAQVKTLAETQDASGLWHTLVMDPTSYLEASATAGFAYGILKGVRKGYLPRHYEQVGIKAVKGVLANIDATGELQQVSFGTAMGDTLQFYKDIRLTSMPYGQSLAICALGEFLRTYI